MTNRYGKAHTKAMLAQETNISDEERSARYSPDFEFRDFLASLTLRSVSHSELLEDIRSRVRACTDMEFVGKVKRQVL